MDFFNSAVDVLQTLVVALGAGLILTFIACWELIRFIQKEGCCNRRLSLL